MIKQLTLFFVLFFVAGRVSHAQQDTAAPGTAGLHFVVTDSRTGLPVPNATITFAVQNREQVEHALMTDSLGNAELKKIRAASYNGFVWAKGYHYFYLEKMMVSRNKMTYVTVALEPVKRVASKKRRRKKAL